MLIIKFLIGLVCILLSVAFFTLLERKLLSILGLRLGPNKVSFIGFFQPIGDALKLSNKQCNVLSNFSFFFYYFSSSLILFSSVIIWICYTFNGTSFISLKFLFLILMYILGFNSLNSILLGWRTFSKYSLVGSLRTVSQLISYESVLYLCFFFFIYYNGRFGYIFSFFIAFLSLPLIFFFWLPSVLADLNRTPYDFSEGERELVRGFNTEFGCRSFTLIFLSEYSNIIFFRVLTRILFFFPFILIFSIFFFFLVIWIRSVLPRFRFDLLIDLAWKFFVPFLTCFFILFLFFMS